MRLLTTKKLKELNARMDAATDAAAWDVLHDELDSQAALIGFPIGYLAIPLAENPIGGYIWAWGMLGKIELKRIEKRDRLAAQGLGGKVSVGTTLMVALLAMRQMPFGQCQIRS